MPMISKTHPPPDSLYADPNAIEHQTTTTGDEYAMVDVKGKKKKKQPTQEAALYQVLQCVVSISTTFEDLLGLHRYN